MREKVRPALGQSRKTDAFGYMNTFIERNAIEAGRRREHEIAGAGRAGDSVANRTCLTRQAAAVHTHAKVVLPLETCNLERRRRDRAPDVPREVLVERAAVHPRGAVPWAEDHACD